MCGIIGYAGAYAPQTLPLDRLHHRGPDDTGLWTDGSYCVLGQTRLAIIDLDERANQPMILGTEYAPGWVMTFNGEIYNYLELKEEFLGNEHFFSESDTEVLLRLWARMGPDCLKHLRGMFSFAIWDVRERALFVARDRLGKKPLVYAANEQRMAFASELGALAELLGNDLDIDPDALDLFFGYQFIPAPYTVFREVKKLPPGHWGVWQNGRMHTQRYWSPPFPLERNDYITDENEALERAEAAIREAVKLRLRADVEVGVLLSGGVDSSLVTAIAAQESSEPLRTFTVGFADQTHNELPYARIVSEQYGTRHHEAVLDGEAVALQWLDAAVGAYGEPFGDKSALPSLMVCSEAAKHVKVVLGGDGGDEAFAGYAKYNPRGARLAIGGFAEAFYAAGLRLEDALQDLPSMFSRSLAGVPDRGMRATSVLHRVLRFDDFFNPRDRELYYREGFRRTTNDARLLFESSLLADLPLPRTDVREKLFSLDWRHYLAGDLLPKMDIASMHSSLEARSPLLDQEVFAVSCAIHPKLKLTPGARGHAVEKRLLKKIAEKYVDPKLLHRPKQGFTPPIAEWLKTLLRERMELLLANAPHPLWELLRRSEMETLYRAHLSGDRGGTFKLWTALVAGLWLERFKGVWRT